MLPWIVLQSTPIRASHLSAYPLLPPSMLGLQSPQNLQSLSLAMFRHWIGTLPPTSFPPVFSLSCRAMSSRSFAWTPPLLCGPAAPSGCPLACSGRLFLPSDVWAPGLQSCAGENLQPTQAGAIRSHGATKQPGNPFQVPASKLVPSPQWFFFTLPTPRALLKKTEAIR